MAKSACPAWLMKCLLPLITKASPSRTARVLIELASEPAPGSVRAKQSVFFALHAGQQVVAELFSGAGHEDLRGPRDEYVEGPGDLRQLAFDQRLGQVVEAAATHFSGMLKA